MTDTTLPSLTAGTLDANRDNVPAVADLAATINIASIASILEFGSTAVRTTNDLTDEVLDRAQAQDLGETGEQLTRIVVMAQEFDFDALDNRAARIPLIGGLLRRLNSAKAKAMARFDTVRGQIDRMVAVVEKTASTLSARDQDYSAIYDAVRAEHAALGLHVAAVRMRLDEVGRNLADLSGTGEDMESLERVAILEAARNALAKRADDLEVVRHSAMQTLPMIRVIQSNNYALVDKFATIRSLTLPAWKRAFMLAIAIAEQKDANDLAVKIDDMTNNLLKRNAELLRENSVAVARSGQRLVIDVETLKSVHGNIIATLDEVRQVHRDGAVARAGALTALSDLRSEMAKVIQDQKNVAA